MDSTRQLRYVYLTNSEIFTLSIDNTRQLFLSSEKNHHSYLSFTAHGLIQTLASVYKRSEALQLQIIRKVLD